MDSDTAEMLAGVPSHEDLTPTEQAVLEEYERLAENMKKVCWTILQSIFSLSKRLEIAHLLTLCEK